MAIGSVKSIETAQSPGITKFRTFANVSILKCFFSRYLLRGVRFVTGLSFPDFFGTRKSVL